MRSFNFVWHRENVKNICLARYFPFIVTHGHRMTAIMSCGAITPRIRHFVFFFLSGMSQYILFMKIEEQIFVPHSHGKPLVSIKMSWPYEGLKMWSTT